MSSLEFYTAVGAAFIPAARRRVSEIAYPRCRGRAVNQSINQSVYRSLLTHYVAVELSTNPYNSQSIKQNQRTNKLLDESINLST